jgi:hypothetical protein
MSLYALPTYGADLSTTATPSAEAIYHMWKEREKDQGQWIAQMRKLRDVYNDDVLLILPEIDKQEDPAVPNLAAQGLDQMAGRAVSVLPTQMYYPLRQGIKASEELARTRTRVSQAWWANNNMSKKLKRRGRHYFGYGYTPVRLAPDFKTRSPRWKYADTLNSFPLLSDDPDDMTPENCIFRNRVRWSWLRTQYPLEASMLSMGDQPPGPDTYVELVEYMDDQVMVTIAVGIKGDQRWGGNAGKKPIVELQRLPNLAGVCLAVTPCRVTLDRKRGMFDGVIGMYKAQAKTFALEMIGVQRNIFAQPFLVARDGQTPGFISGPHDPNSGLINVVEGGEMQWARPPESNAAAMLGDRLERAQRVTASMPSQTGGEMPTRVRTGKGSDAIMSASIDIPIAEAQETFAESLMHENKRAVAIDKAWFGNEKKSFYVPEWYPKAKHGPVDYRANDVFENDNCVVSFPASGTDVNELTILTGQLRGLELISQHTAMFMHPFINDPLEEMRRIDVEKLQAALSNMIDQQAMGGTLPPIDVANIIKYRMAGDEMYEAVQKAQVDAQKRQATAAPPPDAEQGEVAAPETQPGLGPAGQGAEQPSADAPSQGLQNIGDVLSLLRRGQRESPAERNPGGQ